MTVTVLRTPTFRLDHDPASGLTTTRYRDGAYSACPVVPEDVIHAEELGITPQRHRLEHELWHHLVGMRVLGKASSPILYRDAHGLAQPAGWEQEEWLVTALTHALHGRTERDHGARAWLEGRGVEVEALLAEARTILGGIE